MSKYLPSRRWKRDWKEPSALHTPRLEGHYTFDIYECDKQILCLPMRKQPDSTHKTIGYWSCSLNYPECTYNTTHREFFAVMWGRLLPGNDSEGCRSSFTSIQGTLEEILSLRNWTGKSERWKLQLYEFGLDIAHCTGFKLQAADKLLR